METAQPLAEVYHLPIQPTADLLDVDYGGWEGLSAQEAHEKFPALYETWLTRPGHVRFPGGESIRHIRARVEQLLAGLSDQYRGENVVLVSHRITCLVILCSLLGIPNDSLWRMKQDIACLNVIERRDDSYVLALLNGTSHLRS